VETVGLEVPSNSPGEVEPSSARYVLGHSDRELQRLATQAALIEPITRQFLLDAGIAPGMRILDVGTGLGDVAFLAAELVNETGAIVGIDRAPAPLATAQERARARRLRNVSFEVGGPFELTFESPFDAVIGRYVLQFQPEPAAMLRRLVPHVRPGGIVAFHEIDWTGFGSFPPVAIWDRCCRLVTETLVAGGADTRTGTRLPSIFAAAGLPAPSMRMSTIIGAGANSHDAVRRTMDLVLTLLPSMEELGLVTPGELDPETLAERVIDDVTAGGSVVIAASEIGAWCRV
jgi:SAM-dependent methyltransferase